MLQALLIKCMQYCVASTVGCSTCSLGKSLPVTQHLATEGALVDLAAFRSAKWYPVMLKFEHRGHCLTAHIFNCVLVAEPIGTLDSIKHMISPVVTITHIV